MLARRVVIDGVHTDSPTDHRLQPGSAFEEFLAEFVVASDDPDNPRAALKQFRGRELLAVLKIGSHYFVSEFLKTFEMVREFHLHLPAGHEDLWRAHGLVSPLGEDCCQCEVVLGVDVDSLKWLHLDH